MRSHSVGRTPIQDGARHLRYTQKARERLKSDKIGTMKLIDPDLGIDQKGTGRRQARSTI